MTDYYDAILVAIPVAMLGIAGMVSAIGYSVTMGASFGAMVAASVMGHALFVNAPVEDVPGSDATGEGGGSEVSAG